MVSKRVDLNCLVFHGWPAQAPRVWLSWNPKIWSFQPTQQLGWFFFHKEMSSLRQIAALPWIFFYNLFWSNALQSCVLKHIEAQWNTFNCRPAWQICWLGLHKMTLQSGAQPAFCRAESKAIQSSYMRAELSKFSSYSVGQGRSDEDSSFGCLAARGL